MNHSVLKVVVAGTWLVRVINIRLNTIESQVSLKLDGIEIYMSGVSAGGNNKMHIQDKSNNMHIRCVQSANRFGTPFYASLRLSFARVRFYRFDPSSSTYRLISHRYTRPWAIPVLRLELYSIRHRLGHFVKYVICMYTFISRDFIFLLFPWKIV